MFRSARRGSRPPPCHHTAASSINIIVSHSWHSLMTNNIIRGYYRNDVALSEFQEYKCPAGSRACTALWLQPSLGVDIHLSFCDRLLLQRFVCRPMVASNSWFSYYLSIRYARYQWRISEQPWWRFAERKDFAPLWRGWPYKQGSDCPPSQALAPSIESDGLLRHNSDENDPQQRRSFPIYQAWCQ